MKKILLTFLLIPFLLCAQETIETRQSDSSEEINFINATIKPIFPGCEIYDSVEQSKCFGQRVTQTIVDNFVMPKEAADKGLSGRVFISFIVDTLGNITDIHALTGPHELLIKAAEDAVTALPKMTPGVYEGNKVRVRFIVPINIKGENSTQDSNSKKYKRKYKKELKAVQKKMKKEAKQGKGF